MHASDTAARSGRSTDSRTASQPRLTSRSSSPGRDSRPFALWLAPMKKMCLEEARAAWLRREPLEVIGLLADPQPVVFDADELERWLLLGAAYHALGRPIEAADSIEKASLIGPIPDQSRFVLACCYAELRRTGLQTRGPSISPCTKPVSLRIFRC